MYQSSQAAFTATTSNDANQFNAGTVTLTDTGYGGVQGTAMFSQAHDGYLVPGQSGAYCIAVNYGGNVTTTAMTLAPITATYANGGNVPNVATNPLGEYIDLKIIMTKDNTDLLANCNSGANHVGDATWAAAVAGGSNTTTVFGATAKTLKDFNDLGAGGVDLTANFTPSATQTKRIFRFQWTVHSTGAATDNLYKNGTTNIGFAWTASS